MAPPPDCPNGCGPLEYIGEYGARGSGWSCRPQADGGPRREWCRHDFILRAGTLRAMAPHPDDLAFRSDLLRRDEIAQRSRR